MLGFGNIVVAEPTVQIKTILASMPRMVKWHWLLRLITDPKVLWSGVISDGRGYNSGQEKDPDDNLYGCPVRASRKNVGHRERSGGSGDRSVG
jgi:hypothetical protein